MANARPGGDVSQRGPGEYFDPLAPLSSQFQQLESMLELVFDDYESFSRELNEDVLALPPDERFTRSHEVLREHARDRFGSLDSFAALLPESDPEKLAPVLERIFDELLAESLEGVFFQRDPEEHLVLAALLQTFNYGFRRLIETDDREAKNRISSAMLAILSRLQRMGADAPEALPEEAIRDAAYGLHYVTAADDEPAFPSPEGMAFDEVKRRVVEFGAVVAYARLDVSLGRGAELAGVTPEAFRTALDRYDVEPRVGPNSVSELYEDETDE